jgi:tetrapyrrole methylase family protein / MazG family protein
MTDRPNEEVDAPIERLLAVMRRLRSETGCPWDREQTLDSLKPCLIEEAYELLDAIDDRDYDRIREELGDVLLQVVFQARVCEEEGRFDFNQVAAGLCEKLVRRHPHVFGEVKADTADEVLGNWDRIKKQEKGGAQPASIVAGIPRHLPALQKAHQVQKRAARAGFDWPELDGVMEKIEEELVEVREALETGREEAVKEEIGDLLFSVVNLSRFLGHNPEELLHHNVDKFIRRFQALEQQVHATGREITGFSIEELEALWQRVKAEECEVTL